MEDLQIIILLLQIALGVVMLMTRRDANKTRLKLAEIDASRQDDQNVQQALLLAGNIVSTTETLRGAFGELNTSMGPLNTLLKDISAMIIQGQIERASIDAKLVEVKTAVAVSQETMEAVTTARIKWQDHVHGDIELVPAETQRLLQPDLATQTENIRLAFETALSNMEARLMNQLNGDCVNAKQVVQDELSSMRGNLSAMLGRIVEIQTVIETLRPMRVDISETTEPTAGESPAPVVSEPKEG